jgi:hypothetical protein
METNFIPTEQSNLEPLETLLRRALIFPEDVDKYIEEWDENNPDYAGLLNAEILPEET